MSNGRFVDAHDPDANKAYALVTRSAQKDDSQRWILKPLGADMYIVQHKLTSRYMDAHVIEAKDYALVTRPKQTNNTQRWFIKPV
jgi:hypothetical protein